MPALNLRANEKHEVGSCAGENVELNLTVVCPERVDTKFSPSFVCAVVLHAEKSFAATMYYYMNVSYAIRKHVTRFRVNSSH